MAEPAPAPGSSQSFDIVSEYRSLLSADRDLSPAIAAIESLIALLASSPATTISETLDLLSHSSATLRSATANWIALSAGTDLFQRYLVHSLNQPGVQEAGGGGGGGDFGQLRQRLLSNGRLFAQRAKKARGRIAEVGHPFIREGSTILTNGGSRVVGALLLRAAEAHQHGLGTGGRSAFRVIYVLPSPSTTSPSRPNNKTSNEKTNEPHNHQTTISKLRSHKIPVSTIPATAVATALPLSDQILIGAEAVVESGGIISRVGTHQLALLAQCLGGKAVYVAVESYKFVRLFPLSTAELPIRQKIVEFWPRDAGGGGDGSENGDAPAGQQTMMGTAEREEEEEGLVEFTPPHLISAFITENGILTPSAISEELVKLWV